MSLVDRAQAEFALLTASGISPNVAGQVMDDSDPGRLAGDVVDQAMPSRTPAQDAAAVFVLGRLTERGHVPLDERRLAQRRLWLARAAAEVGLDVSPSKQEQNNG